MKRIQILVCMLAAALLPFGVQAKNYVVKSPSGKLVLTVASGPKVTWQVDFAGREVISPSEISLRLLDGRTWGTDAPAGKVSKVSRTVAGVNYRKARIDDTYSLLTLRGRGYTLEFRVYDDAAAYRFIAGVNDSVYVENETVEYRFPADREAWVPYVNDMRYGERYSNSFEAYYDRLKITQMPSRKLALMPFVVDLGEGMKAALTTVGEIDYPGMYLHSSFSKGIALTGEFPGYPDLANSELGKGVDTENFKTLFRKNYIARIGGRQQLPWRAVIVSENDAQLADCSLVQKLCRPAEGTDFSWVKPGKSAWEWWCASNVTGVDFESGMNTDTYKHFADFAARHNLEYMILDGGWYAGDIVTAKSKIDLPQIISYAKSKGVGVVLWLSWKAAFLNMHTAFPVYEKWGIKGLKIDYVDANDQFVLQSVKRISEFAAKHHLFIDWHGMQLNGMQVAYPNILNIEGVRGLEQVKWQSGAQGTQGADMPGYDVTVPFSRMITAPVDYTPGAMRNATRRDYRASNVNPMSQGTRVHQMAMYTVFDAPLQMLADRPSNYELFPDCIDFIAKVPTVFDDHRTLSGSMGQYIVTAKRSGTTWYVGAMTNWDERTVQIPLSFLGEGKYRAVVFSDGVNASKSAEDYKCREITVTRNDCLDAVMKSGGGWTARFEKL